MSVSFQSPNGYIELPNPQDEDNEGLEAAIQIHTSINNITRVYRRAHGCRRLVMTFQLSIPKAEQLKIFLRQNIATWLQLTDYRGRQWRCLITSRPPEFVENKRHRVGVTLDILGTQL